MSLYHETAEILSAPTGGSVKSRIFSKKDLKTPTQQIYALALESCKWSSVLKEVIEAAQLLRHERKLSPVLALLLVHDLLLAKRGVALPASHGLRTSIERHKARLSAEFTRAKLRRKAPSTEALREQVETEFLGESAGYPRWVRVNTLKSNLEDQLETTFKDFTRVYSVADVTASPQRRLYIDTHIPNLLAVSPNFEITKSSAYSSGAIILQDKASCFPAYLLDPRAEDGDVLDSCAAPGNKTTHLAAIVKSRVAKTEPCTQKVFACEKDTKRARTLDKMVKLAGAKDMTKISFGQDFLKLEPDSDIFKDVGCMLLDPSCSGSGIVGRDVMPTIHLAELPGQAIGNQSFKPNNKKRKRDVPDDNQQQVLVDDDGKETVLSSEKELQARLEALSSFQLTLLEHAFRFPSARKITYSTCSVHAEENEQVVLKVLESDIARRRGWRILKRDQQVRGMREWPVRGLIEACDGNEDVAAACIRAYKGDGQGVMGFFVAAFVRDAKCQDVDPDGPYLRDEDGQIIRDFMGMPTLKHNPIQGGQPDLQRDDSRVMDVEVPSETRATEDTSDDDDDDSSSEDQEEEEWEGFD